MRNELDLKEDKFLELLVMQPEELVAQKKDGERQEEEVTKKKKKNQRDSQRRRWQGDVLYLRRLFVSEKQDLNVERSMKFAAAVQSVIQCYHVIYGERKSYYPDVTGSVLQEGQED